MEKSTSSKCECRICVRNRKAKLLLDCLSENEKLDHVEFLREILEDLEYAEFELDWITSGMSKEYLSTKEVIEKLNIPENKIREFLKIRRERS